jgi:hypothetical protein
MQEARSNEQGTLENRLYYVSNNYIVQEDKFLKCPILVKRNGGGSDHEMNTVLKICGMKIKEKESSKRFILEGIRNG